MFKEIYQSFLRTKGFVLGILPLAIAWLLWVYQPDAAVKIKWAIPLIALFLIIIVVLLDCIYHLNNQAKHILPRVLQAREPHAIHSESHCLLLLSESPLFGQDSLVSIYSRESDFEILIGVGFVTAIQENGLIQVVVIENSNEESSIWDKISNNDQTLLKKLIVKPSVVKNFKYQN